jgi:AbrB family looped-hinge helix DNA binding protein
MLSTSSLSSKGQLTLPRRVREYLEVEAGDTIIFELVDDLLVIRKAKDVQGYFRTLPPLDVPFDKQALEENIAAEVWKDR